MFNFNMQGVLDHIGTKGDHCHVAVVLFHDNTFVFWFADEGIVIRYHDCARIN